MNLGSLLVVAIVGLSVALAARTIRSPRRDGTGAADRGSVASRLGAGTALFLLVGTAEVLIGRALEGTPAPGLWPVLWAAMFVLVGVVVGAAAGTAHRSTVATWIGPAVSILLGLAVVRLGGLVGAAAAAGPVVGGAAMLLTMVCVSRNRPPVALVVPNTQLQWLPWMEEFATEERDRQCPICRSSRWVSRPRTEWTALKCPSCGRVFHARCFRLFGWCCPNSSCGVPLPSEARAAR